MPVITVKSQFYFDRIDERTKQITPSLITGIADRITKYLEPDKIFLFGSQANHKANQNSDIDLLIVIADTHQLASLNHRDRFGVLLDLFPYRLFGLDAIIVTNAEIQLLQDINEGEWDLILEILAKGILLYDSTQKAQVK